MIWFTSDLHLFHANVIQYCARPYTTVDEMNQALVDNWNRLVGPDDDVYCLGDFSLAFRPVELFSGLLAGRKHLVPGNHDLCHSYNKRSRSDAGRARWTDQYRRHGWQVLPEQTTLEVPGLATFNLCHLPYSGRPRRDLDPQDKYRSWRPPDDGRWLICGHVHEKWRQLGRMINVGVDVWAMQPVNLDTLAALVGAGPVVGGFERSGGA